MRVIQKLWNVILTLLLIAAAVLVIAFAGVRLAGLTPFAVLSGSMEPKYPVGSLIYVKNAEPASVQVGDAITFRQPSGMLVTHEVYQIDVQEQLFYTQGIANKNGAGEIMHDAAPTSWATLVGVPIACIPYLGYVNAYITQPPGLYIMVSLVGVVLAVSIVFELVNTSAEERAQKREAQPAKASTQKREEYAAQNAAHLHKDRAAQNTAHLHKEHAANVSNQNGFDYADAHPYQGATSSAYTSYTGIEGKKAGAHFRS